VTHLERAVRGHIRENRRLLALLSGAGGRIWPEQERLALRCGLEGEIMTLQGLLAASALVPEPTTSAEATP
jgi:hypothetical protein